MNSLTVEVNMVQHSFDDPIDGRVTDLEKVIKKFIKDSYQNQRKNQETIWGIKMEYDEVLKSQAKCNPEIGGPSWEFSQNYQRYKCR